MKNVMNTTAKDWIGPVVAVVVTALFLIFCTPLYELMYYEPDFANEMYEENMYFLCAALTCLIVWAVVIIYYLVVDRWHRWWQWLIALVVAGALAPTVVFYYPDSYFINMEEPIDFSVQLTNFSLVSTICSVLMFIILSFCIKSLSRNCTTTPF